MALLFPAIGTVKETAKKTQAKSDEQGIVTAVKAYYAEYAKYPTLSTDDNQTKQSSSGSNNNNNQSNDTFTGDKSLVDGVGIQFDNSALFNTLRNLTGDPNTKDHLTNPRQIVFFEGKTVSNPESPKGGFLDATNNNNSGANAKQIGCFFDPWGFQYAVGMDTDYDNQVDVSKIYTDFPSESSPHLGVVVLSVGKDGQVGSPSQNMKNMYKQGTKTADDVISWQ